MLLDAAVGAALGRGETSAALPRDHATELRRGGRDRPGAGVCADGRGARPCRPPVVGGRAPRGPRGEGRRRCGLGRDMPALPRPDGRAVRRSRSSVMRPVRHLATTPDASRPRRVVGWPRGWLARPRGDRPRARSPVGREGRSRPRRAVQRDQQRRARDRDAAALALLGGRRSRPTDARTAGRPPLDDSGPTVRARAEGRDRSRTRRRPRAVRSVGSAVDPGRRPPSHQRLHPVRGPRVTAPSAGCPGPGPAGDPRRSIRGAARGGQFVEREIAT